MICSSGAVTACVGIVGAMSESCRNRVGIVGTMSEIDMVFNLSPKAGWVLKNRKSVFNVPFLTKISEKVALKRRIGTLPASSTV